MTSAILMKVLATALVAGLIGGAVMELVMWTISRTCGIPGNMIVALGSLITKSRNRAFRVGLIVHVISAVGFAACYVLLMITLEMTKLPQSLMLGLGVGALHGLLVSLMLVWIVSDQHPLPEFNEADLAIGLNHFAAHVAFGAVIGMVVGLSPL